MKRTIFCIFSFLLFFNIILIAQSITWQRILNNNYGGLKRVQQTFDGGYIAVGTDLINNSPKIYLTKLDYLGNTLWTKIIGVGKTESYWVEETSDRGFIIGGSTDSGTSDYDAYLIKTDSLGIIQWQKRYFNSDFDFCYCVKQTPDGGYILSCRYFPYRVGTWFIKTDNLGNIMWQKIYYNASFHIDAIYEIKPLNDEYIAVGLITNISLSQTDGYVMRLNFNGDTIWTMRYGGNGVDGFYSIDKVNNDGFILAGYTLSFNPNHPESYLVRTDNIGNIVWQKTYSNNYLNDYDMSYSVIYKQNTGFIMAGESDTVGPGITYGIIRIIDTSGNMLKQKLYFPGDRGGWFRNINFADDGGFILGGTSIVPGRKMYVVKTDSLLDANPIAINNNNENVPVNFILFQNYPNPFNSETIIRLEVKKKSEIKILIHDITGRKIKTFVNSNFNIGFYSFVFSSEKLNLSSGVYFYSLYIDNSGLPYVTKKLVYMK